MAVIDKKKCKHCQKEKKTTSNFYKVNSPFFPDGCLDICTACIRDIIPDNDQKAVQKFLREINKPFLYDIWEKSTKQNGYSIGNYLRAMNMGQYASKTWDDSVFDDAVLVDRDSDIGSQESNKADFVVTDEIREKWGYGFKDDEYMFFEKKYNFLKNNYPERTSLHIAALQDYVIKKVKEELCIAAGELDKAAKWSKMASDAATAAKINPNQLSKADLSSGLDGFGQLVRSVEQAVDIIDILPVFKERPQDKVDFTIWCYINYIRDMKGLPLVEYSEIYRFYEDRVKEYEEVMNVDDSEAVY